MTEESIGAKLAYFRQAIQKLERMPQASYEEFTQDFRSLEATLHLLQVAIQIAIDLAIFAGARLGLPPAPTSRAVLEALEGATHLPPGSVARFGPVFGFRNRIVHLYDRIDPRIVHEILVHRRGDLEELVGLLAELITDGASG